MKVFSREIAVKIAVITGILFSIPSFADAYRCTLPDGRVGYQQQPCSPSSSQKTIDDTNARKQREAEETRLKLLQADKENAEKAVKQTETKALLLSACINKQVECQDSTYRQGLQCMTPNEVERILGSPSRKQNIGGRGLIYYSVPIHNGSRFVTGRLQLVVGFSGNCASGISNPSNRIAEVNIY